MMMHQMLRKRRLVSKILKGEDIFFFFMLVQIFVTMFAKLHSHLSSTLNRAC